MANNNDIVQLQIQPEILDVDTSKVHANLKATMADLKNQMSALLTKIPESANISKPINTAMRNVVSAYKSATKAMDTFSKAVEMSQQSVDRYNEALEKVNSTKRLLSEYQGAFEHDESYYRNVMSAVEQQGGPNAYAKTLSASDRFNFHGLYREAQEYTVIVDGLREVIQEAEAELTGLKSQIQSADGEMAVAIMETTRWDAALQQANAAIEGVSDASDSSSESANRQVQIFNRLMSVLSGISRAAKTAFSIMRQTIQRVAHVVSDLYNRFTKLFSGFNKGSKGMNFNSKKLFKTFLQFGLGVRSLYFLIRRMRTEFIKGMKQMAASFPEVNEQVSSLAMAFNQLKGSAVTMIQPILASVIPVLIRLFNVLSAVMEKIAQFFAVLRGQKVIYKAAAANVDYAESVDDVGGSAKEANKELAEYDNLLVIPQDSAGSGGGGGGAGAEEPYSFEEVPIDAISDFAKKLKEAWESADYEGVGNVIAEKLNSVILKIDDWILNVLEPKGIDWANRIARIGNGLFEKWDAELAGKTVSDFFNALFKIVDEFVTTFNWAQAGEKIGNALISALSNFNASAAGETVRKFFEGLFDAGISLFVQNPGGLVGAKLAEFINSLFDPNSGTLGGFIGGIVTNITAFFKSVFENIDWNNLKEFLQTNFSSLADGLGFSDEVKSNIAKVTEPIFEIFQSIAEFVQKIDFEKVFGSILEMLGSISSLFESIWSVIGPVLEYAMNNMFPRLNKSTATFFDGLSKFLDDIGPLLSPLLEMMMEAGTAITEIVNSGISAVLQIVGVLLKPIAKLLGSVLKMLQPISEHVSEFVSSMIGEVLELVLSLLEPITALLEPILEILGPILELLGPILDIIINIIELAIKPLIHIIKALVYFLTGDFEAAGGEMKEMFGDIGTSINKLKDNFVKFKDKLVEIWNKIRDTVINLKNKIVETWDEIKSSIGEKIEGIKTKITNVWNTIKSWVSDTVTGIKDKVVGKFEELKNGVSTTFENLKNTLSRIWEGIWNVIKTPINWILAGIETLANGVVNGLNTVIGALNSLHFDVPDWVPLIGGKTFGFNIGYLGGVSLPRLAQGAVIPPNKEFLAVLGDQSSGTNIEAPLDTIKQALAEVMAELGTSSQMPEKIQIVMPNSKVLAETVWDEEQKLYKQTGMYSPRFA